MALGLPFPLLPLKSSAWLWARSHSAGTQHAGQRENEQHFYSPCFHVIILVLLTCLWKKHTEVLVFFLPFLYTYTNIWEYMKIERQSEYKSTSSKKKTAGAWAERYVKRQLLPAMNEPQPNRTRRIFYFFFFFFKEGSRKILDGSKKKNGRLVNILWIASWLWHLSKDQMLNVKFFSFSRQRSEILSCQKQENGRWWFFRLLNFFLHLLL